MHTYKNIPFTGNSKAGLACTFTWNNGLHLHVSQGSFISEAVQTSLLAAVDLDIPTANALETSFWVTLAKKQSDNTIDIVVSVFTDKCRNAPVLVIEGYDPVVVLGEGKVSNMPSSIAAVNFTEYIWI